MIAGRTKAVASDATFCMGVFAWSLFLFTITIAFGIYLFTTNTILIRQKFDISRTYASLHLILRSILPRTI